MGLVKTDLRFTREKAKKIRFYPAGGIPATNVQDAIEEALTIATTSPPSITPTPVTFAMSPYTALPTDYFLAVDTSGGPVTIVLGLASARSGREITVKDATGQADVNNITVNRTAPDTLDTLTSYPIASSFDSKTFQPETGGYAVK